MIYLNGEKVEVTLFPDNTSQVWKLDERHFNEERANILWEYSHEGELMHIAQLKMLLDNTVDRVYLHIEFLPYGRQDKSIANDHTFGLYTFAHIINSLNFTEIFIMDPHSSISLAALNKSCAVYPYGPLERAIRETTSNLFCYPDKGAAMKYTTVYSFSASEIIYGEKVRDQLTGHITSYELKGKCEDKRVLIVDDICDGGKTFELLAEELYSAGAEEVNLFVTHGLFTKGLRGLKAHGIRRIFTNKGEAILMYDGELGFRPVEKIKPRCAYCGDDALFWNGTRCGPNGCYNVPA